MLVRCELTTITELQPGRRVPTRVGYCARCPRCERTEAVKVGDVRADLHDLVETAAEAKWRVFEKLADGCQKQTELFGRPARELNRYVDRLTPAGIALFVLDREKRYPLHWVRGQLSTVSMTVVPTVQILVCPEGDTPATRAAAEAYARKLKVRTVRLYTGTDEDGKKQYAREEVARYPNVTVMSGFRAAPPVAKPTAAEKPAGKKRKGAAA